MMIGTSDAVTHNAYSNGLIQHSNDSVEEKLDELRCLMGKTEGDPLRIVGVGAGAWGSVFAAMLQDSYEEDVLRRLIRRCAYLKYVEARLGDRTLYADELLKRWVLHQYD
ncbi:hypothetical protein L3X38_000346 [Prunus dulcis]|uniref:Uncharacterized protein n=1 Tax=Prunus dulcis TaxID=3755 RepID=A0AAD4URR1_PRUDU|nr:hypothetical protein L3X38_000346 [Prunus dulcis]